MEITLSSFQFLSRSFTNPKIAIDYNHFFLRSSDLNRKLINLNRKLIDLNVKLIYLTAKLVDFSTKLIDLIHEP
ncbi:hypothetical protein L195_g038554 [Trifolium pratense]|uniref:Uncharacterized protein n=1 Tax=Trifolium pratense TaxID=57577 RepID=A0A2K3LVG4_TRIPR|nr:hypothetical protein L195_g038554 [Trifolium pratense]